MYMSLLALAMLPSQADAIKKKEIKYWITYSLYRILSVISRSRNPDLDFIGCEILKYTLELKTHLLLQLEDTRTYK